MGKNRLYLNLSVINCWTSSILIKLAAIFMAYGYLSIYDIREFIFYVFLLPFVFWLVNKLHKCYKMKNHK